VRLPIESGIEPDNLLLLSNLHIKYLSNNQLTGSFPGWVNRLRKLKLLNLGQNDFSGEVPSSFRLEHDGGDRFLNNLPSLMQQRLLPYGALVNGQVWRSIMRPYRRFSRKYHALQNISPNMLWIDAENMNNEDPLELEKIVGEFFKAEEKYLWTKSFQILRNHNNGRLLDLFQNGYMVKKLAGS